MTWQVYFISNTETVCQKKFRNKMYGDNVYRFLLKNMSVKRDR